MKLNWPDRTKVWVMLYSDSQGAYHLETLEEYERKPSNGYRIVKRGKYDELSREIINRRR